MTKEDGSDSIVIAITCLQTSDLYGANLKNAQWLPKWSCESYNTILLLTGCQLRQTTGSEEFEVAGRDAWVWAQLTKPRKTNVISKAKVVMRIIVKFGRVDKVISCQTMKQLCILCVCVCDQIFENMLA